MSFTDFQTSAIDTFEKCKNQIQSSKILQSAITVTSLYIGRELWYWAYRKYHKLPPGPNGIPFIGCFFEMQKDCQWQVKMATKYGPVIWVPMIGTSFIFLSDPVLIKQLFPQKEFLRRDDSRKEEFKQSEYKSLWSVGQNVMPLISINGKNWQKRRKHAQAALFRTMTNSYVGNVMYKAINSELVPYLDELIKENKPWYPRELCQYLAFNTLYHTLFGYQIKRDCKLYNELMTDFDNTFKLTGQNALAANYKLFRMLTSVTEKMYFTRNRRNGNIKKLIKQRIEDKQNNNDEQMTYIDVTHQMVLNGDLTEDEEIADVYFLFIAGQDTTSSTLDFGIILAGKYQEIQEMVRTELLSVMQDLFNLKLVHNCPLFRAFVHEILRIASVAYIGVQHASISDKWVNVNGKKMKIPKNTAIFTNMDYIHVYNKNDKNWKYIDGDKIFLENWLSNDKSRFIMNESFVGFGVGRRDCVGRQLAMKEVQYILGYLLMNYKITLDKPIDNIANSKKGNFATVFISPKIGVRIHKYSA